MTSTKSRPEDHEAKTLPADWALTSPLLRPRIVSPVLSLWLSRARAELPVTGNHFKQRVALQKRGVVVPDGNWVALDDPSTADPKSFHPDRLTRTDKVLMVIKVTAALALEIAVRDAGMPLASTSLKIARDLYEEGLKAPGTYNKAYKGHTVERWRKDFKSSSDLYRDGLRIFRRFKTSWTEVLNLTCVEARIRASLREMHCDDPDGSKASIAFVEWIAELKARHEQWYREHVMAQGPIRPETRAWLERVRPTISEQAFEDRVRDALGGVWRRKVE